MSGTYGITGSVDTTLVIQRKRLETFGKLVVTGRDVAEVEEPVQFNGMTWSQAPRSLAEASFEQAEVYKVIEAEGPIFPKAIADLIGSSREAVQRLVEKLVAGGSVARARRGYVVASVRIAEEAEEAEPLETSVWTSSASLAGAPAHAGVTTASTSSPSSGEIREEAEEAGTHVRVREGVDAGPVLRVVPADPTGWLNPCHWYRDHQSRHRQTPSGWTCDACYPEEDPA